MALMNVFPKGFLKGYNIIPVSSVFGKRMLNSVLRFHNGIDIACNEGTPIICPCDAIISVNAIQKGGAGLHVSIAFDLSSSEEVSLSFFHLKTATKLKVLQNIKKGELIGTVGGRPSDKPNCGNSGAVHLHLEVHINNMPVNPLLLFSKFKTFNHKTQKIYLKGDSKITKIDTTELTTKPFELVYGSIAKKGEISNTEKDLPTEVIATVKENMSEQNRLAAGVWQITKLLIDSSVSEKQLNDTSLPIMTGSLLNFFRKVCQEPLVEFMGDTFGDQYYYIVRKPPFDRTGFQKLIDSTLIILSSDNIASTNLEWNNEGIYSWYRYLPVQELFGGRETVSCMPAVFFPEFASVWGSRPLDIESGYYTYKKSGIYNSDQDNIKLNVDNLAKNAFNDLKFLVESNAYAPFTRRGTIVLNPGDRRIKRGTVIRHTSGEVFYVEQVTNSYDVSLSGTNRTTTLTVSHGIYPEFIQGETINGKVYSYFDIIDFGKEVEVNFKSLNSASSKWKVNLDVFGFFMRREQSIRF